MREKTGKRLFGQDFDIVKEGLDEAQVEAFITKLTNERDRLAENQGHMLSLTKLAERTVVEADKLAEQIKVEADEEARAKATKILAKAEQNAQEFMEQKRSEIIEAANKEAEAIRSKARQEAELFATQQEKAAREAISEMTEKLHARLVSGLKGVMEQAVALPAEWQNILSKPVTDSANNGDELPSAPPAIPQARNDTAPAPAPPSEPANRQVPDILKQLEQTWGDAGAGAGPKMAMPASKPAPEVVTQPVVEVEDNLSTMLNKGEPSVVYQGTVDIAILPPVSPSQLVEIQSYLRDWPGIGISELRPSNNGYSIIVVLDKPIQLVDILKQLPEIGEARECAVEKSSAAGKCGARKIAITLARNM